MARHFHRQAIWMVLIFCGCADPTGVKEKWFNTPVDDHIFANGNKIEWVYEVSKSGYEKISDFLEDKAIIPFINNNDDGQFDPVYYDLIGPENLCAKLADLINPKTNIPKDSVICLVRALYVGYPYCFGAMLDDSDLVVVSQSLGGRGFRGDFKRTALVIALPRVPKNVFIQVSLTE